MWDKKDGMFSGSNEATIYYAVDDTKYRRNGHVVYILCVYVYTGCILIYLQTAEFTRASAKIRSQVKNTSRTLVSVNSEAISMYVECM